MCVCVCVKQRLFVNIKGNCKGHNGTLFLTLDSVNRPGFLSARQVVDGGKCGLTAGDDVVQALLEGNTSLF